MPLLYNTFLYPFLETSILESFAKNQGKAARANKKRMKMALSSALAILLVSSSVFSTEGLNKNGKGLPISFGRCDRDMLAQFAKKNLDRDQVRPTKLLRYGSETRFQLAASEYS